MAGVELIHPGVAPEGFAERIELAGLPPAMRGSADGGILFGAIDFRVMASLFPPLNYFDQIDHRQVSSREPLRCAVYFTADPGAYASCTLVDGQHYIIIGVELIEQLVRCSVALGPALALRGEKEPDIEAVRFEPSIDAILADRDPLTDDERLRLAEIVKGWPIPGLPSEPGAPGLAEMTVLHDLVRLVVVHEFAHCVCGHVAFFSREMGATELPEFGEVRDDQTLHEALAAPRTHILQAIETHADDWSISFSAQQVLVGHDPAGLMFAERVDLIDRMLLLNVAFGIFAITWTLKEQRTNPGMTFRVADTVTETDQGPDVIRSMGRPFTVVRSSHPPAVFRYFRHLYLVYGACNEHYGAQGLGTYVATHTTGFLGSVAGRLSRYFYSLLNYTPSFADTPDMKTLGAYEDYMFLFSTRMAPYIDEYLPAAMLEDAE